MEINLLPLQRPFEIFSAAGNVQDEVAELTMEIDGQEEEDDNDKGEEEEEEEEDGDDDDSGG